MDLLLDDETEAFRAEVREFLVSNVPNPPLPSYDSPEGAVAHRQWERTLYDAGFSAVSWPKEYGGRDVTLLQWVIFEEEYFKAGAPARISQNGMFLLGPTLFAHGSKDQLDRVLPKMANGEEIWAQAWSEPESGSDLASLRSPLERWTGAGVCLGRRSGVHERPSRTEHSACFVPIRTRSAIRV